ncbi:hypothetical protein GBAR_LOCUS9740 [Geodia barretti]|uniref:Uncharacterized protein n=1 Tax=Geodia barretti TaxID=519541 RepID=A0AA35WIN0_GEOBA|nr:hypothetical protein GBAR_LOCUS9740 [Geodia barretti]
MRMLTSFYTPDVGGINIDGLDTKEHDIATRERIGYLPENNPVYADLLVSEYLDFVADLRGLTKVWKTRKHRSDCGRDWTARGVGEIEREDSIDGREAIRDHFRRGKCRLAPRYIPPCDKAKLGALGIAGRPSANGRCVLFSNFASGFRGGEPVIPWLLALLVPAATMRLLAEEQRDGTLEILLTHPIQGWVILLAKFTAGLVFVTIAIASTVGIPISLMTAGNLDWGAIAAQYIGSVFLAASLVSIGLFTSSLTRNQIVSFILGLFLTLVLMLLGLDAVSVTLPGQFAALLQSLSPVTHFSSIARGVIDLRDVLYFVALVSTFLSATFLSVRGRTLSHRTIQYRNLQLEQILSGLDDLLTIELYESKEPPVQVDLVARDINDFLEDLAGNSKGQVKLVRRFLDFQALDEAQRALERAQDAILSAEDEATVAQCGSGLE